MPGDIDPDFTLIVMDGEGPAIDAPVEVKPCDLDLLENGFERTAEYYASFLSRARRKLTPAEMAREQNLDANAIAILERILTNRERFEALKSKKQRVVGMA